MNIVPKNVLKYRSQKSMMKYEGAPSFTATRWTRPGTSARRFFFWTPRISIPVHWIFFLLRRTGRRFSDGFWAAGRPPTGRRATFEQLHRRWCPTWSRSAQIIHTHKHRRTTLQNSRQREKNPYPVVFFLLSISGYVPIIILDLRSRSWRTFRHGHNISEKTFSYKVWKIIKPLSSLHLYLSCADRGCNHGKIKTIFQALPYSEIQVPSWIPRHQNKWEFTRFCYDHTETLFPALPYLGKK